MSLIKSITKYEEFLAKQGEHLILWLAVAFAVGCGVYFALSFEPQHNLLYSSFSLAALITFFLGREIFHAHDKARYPIFLFCITVLFLFAGVVTASLRTYALNTPILANTPSPMMVEGRIAEISRTPQNGWATLVLDDITSHDFKKLRLTSRLRGNPFQGVNLNDRVQILVKLSPPSRPVIVGAFDFQRYSFFQGFSAQGFVLKPPIIIHSEPNSFFSLEEKRALIHEKLREILSPSIAAIAHALMTGERADIADEDWNALRASGLAHIISISGLHVVMVAVPIFFIIRLFLVMIPYCALHWPTKKIAAFVALLVCCAYVGFVVPSVPTTRALLMTCIGLIAIMLDRSPFSFRLVGFSAFIILLFYPESIISASFQLSFAAVMALIWTAQIIQPFYARMRERGGLLTRGLWWLGVATLTSFSVSIITAPLTSFHFQQIPLYGVVANALAMPITGILIMPMIILSFALMPLGLAHIPITILGFGIESMLAVANMVAAWPYAVWLTPHWPLFALILFSFAGLILFLGRGGVWKISVLLCGGAFFVILASPQPVIHIAEHAKQIIVKSDSGRGILLSGRAEKFMTQTALKHMDIVKPDKLAREGAFGLGDYGSISCGQNACRYDLSFIKLAAGKNVAALYDDCSWAKVIVTSAYFAPENCQANIFDRKRFFQTGAIAIFKDGSVRTVAEDQGRRPWTTWRGQGIWISRDARTSNNQS
jgi:competence protein ComEC